MFRTIWISIFISIHQKKRSFPGHQQRAKLLATPSPSPESTRPTTRESTSSYTTSSTNLKNNTTTAPPHPPRRKTIASATSQKHIITKEASPTFSRSVSQAAMGRRKSAMPPQVEKYFFKKYSSYYFKFLFNFVFTFFFPPTTIPKIHNQGQNYSKSHHKTTPHPLAASHARHPCRRSNRNLALLSHRN